MKVFLDTNIVIDFYDQRGDFYYPAAVIFDLAHMKLKFPMSVLFW